jgi:hypothetical protein
MTPALRLVFAYQGTDVQFIEMQAVDQYVMPSDDLDDLDGFSGFWYEHWSQRGIHMMPYRRFSHRLQGDSQCHKHLA